MCSECGKHNWAPKYNKPMNDDWMLYLQFTEVLLQSNVRQAIIDVQQGGARFTFILLFLQYYLFTYAFFLLFILKFQPYNFELNTL